MISAETVELSSLELSNTTPNLPDYPLQLETDFINPSSEEELQSAVALLRQLEDKFSRLEQELALLRNQLAMSTFSDESGPTEASDRSCNKLKHERLSSSEETTEQQVMRTSSSPEVVFPHRKRRKYVRRPQVSSAPRSVLSSIPSRADHKPIYERPTQTPLSDR